MSACEKVSDSVVQHITDQCIHSVVNKRFEVGHIVFWLKGRNEQVN